MSFSRIRYDDDAYKLKIDRSIGPGDYRLFKGNSENCSKCYATDGPKNAKSDTALAGKENTSDIEWSFMADVESHLTNRVNKLVDSNIYGGNDAYKNIPINISKNCTNILTSEDTRFSFPLEAYRSMDLTSYHYSPFLYTNPQCEIQSDRSGLNSRLRVKDTFKTIDSRQIDQSSILPKGNDVIQDLSKKYTENICKNLN